MAFNTLNKIELIGRLGRDPEMRYTPQGSAVTNFSVATGGKYTTKSGDERDDTEWFRVECWNQTAEFVNNYLQKGGLVYVEGKLRTRKYEDKDGVERTAVEVVANTVMSLGGKSDSNASENTANTRSAPQKPAQRAAGQGTRNVPQAVGNEEDLPF